MLPKIIVNFQAYRSKLEIANLYQVKGNNFNKIEQEGHDGTESLTRNNCFSVLEIIHWQYFLILNLREEYV
jgi:hypothetical protein